MVVQHQKKKSDEVDFFPSDRSPFLPELRGSSSSKAKSKSGSGSTRNKGDKRSDFEKGKNR